MKEAVTIGLFLVLVFGAVSFYLYSRLSYTEKRLGLMENMLLDIKMGIDGMNKEEPEYAPEPVPGEQPQPVEEAETEVLPEEETYYQSVLASAGSSDKQEQEQEQEVSPTQPTPNYESMSKDELVALCEKKGLKVGKRPGRKDLIAALRKGDSTSKGDEAEVAGSSSSSSDLFPNAAPLNSEEVVAETLE
jgi:hypothetical protein